MSRKPGDWDCAQCNHLNFSRRDSCQRCGEMRDRPRDSVAEFSSSRNIGGGGSSGGGRSYGFISGPPGRFGGSGGGSGSGDVRPGDWYCSDCNAHNFASRTGCYKCGANRDEEPENGGGGGGGRFDSGGWREQGPRRYMVAPTPAASSYGRSAWKSGDWICPRMGCEEHNFASRIECFRCSARRETADM